VSLKIGISKSSWTQNDAAPNLGRFRSPWVLGMIVRRDLRGTGLGRLLLGHLERWARDQGHQQLWVATGGPAVNFYRRCGWQFREIVHRDFGPATVLNKLLDNDLR
jgi:GNAT superfamily N-acetyltransferase